MTYANLRPTASAILLLIGVSSAAALTLERSRGVVVLGRPLDFNVQATVSSGEDASSLCLEADVFQADTPIDPARLNVQLLKAGANGFSTLRVSSPVVVEEPVLTVVIRYGCLSKNSRRYVVLADPPLNISESTVGPDRSSGPSLLPPAETIRRADRGEVVVRGSSPRSAVARTKPNAAAPQALVQSRRLGASQDGKDAKPRLQLDGIEAGIDPNPRLKATLELLAVPSEQSSAQRSEAAALWRVIASTSEDLQKDIQRLTALQAETKVLQEASAKSRVEISRLSGQLKDSEQSRFQNPLVYALAAALGLLLAAIAFMRFGTKSEPERPAWWKPVRDKVDKQSPGSSTGPNADQSGKDAARQREPLIPLRVKPVVRLSESKDSEPVAVQPSFKASESAYALLGGQGGARGVNVEELFDIQQQADFFISLGQNDQAIEVLENHIRENAQTSPLVYLDLLKLYHRQEKRTEYRDLTDEFTRLFNADVPKFDAFKDETRGIEAYEATLSQIVSCWQTDRILKVIEDSVLREAGRTSETLDLEAYRELLLLHSIAKDLSDGQVINSYTNEGTTWPKPADAEDSSVIAGATIANFNPTIPQKLKTSGGQGETETLYDDVRSGAFQKPVGARIGLDIDLTAASLEVPIAKETFDSKPGQEETAVGSDNSGLIEFDFDSFKIDSDSKIVKK